MKKISILTIFIVVVFTGCLNESNIKKAEKFIQGVESNYSKAKEGYKKVKKLRQEGFIVNTSTELNQD